MRFFEQLLYKSIVDYTGHVSGEGSYKIKSKTEYNMVS